MLGEEQGRTSGGQTDVAALGAGVVGVAVSTVLQPGAYNPFVAIVAATLGLVIVGYTGGHRRSALQRLAFSSVMGLLAIPLIGLALERDWSASDTSVPPRFLIWGWLGAGFITFGIDTYRQQRAENKSRTASAPKPIS